MAGSRPTEGGGHLAPTLFSRPVIGRVPIIRVNLAAQSWSLGEPHRVSRYHWTFHLAYKAEGREYRVRCELEQDGQEIAIRLPWKARPDYGIGDHNAIHLEGDDQKYNTFLVAVISTMNRCWHVRDLFEFSPLALFVGPFRSLDGTVRRWAEVCGEPTEALKNRKRQGNLPGRQQVVMRLFLRALANGCGKVGASRILAKKLGYSDSRAYTIASNIIERDIELFYRSRNGYTLSAEGQQFLDSLERAAFSEERAHE